MSLQDAVAVVVAAGIAEIPYIREVMIPAGNCLHKDIDHY